MAELANQADFPDTPEGWSRRWQVEMTAAKKAIDKWLERGDKTVKRYLDDRAYSRNQNDRRLNLFHANIDTVGSLIYGKTPQVSVQRRFADSADDQARVASEMLERLLNTDIEDDSDTYKVSLRNALQDRLLPGMGNCRVRYEAEFTTQPGTPAIKHPVTGQELAPEIPEQDVKTDEEVCIDYVPWRDQLWSPSRTFNELRWWGFKAEMTKEQLKQRFGEEVAAVVPLNSTKGPATESKDESARKEDPWQRADVWEIWSKEHKRVFWVVDGHSKTLDIKNDPLGLESFWPFPMPMMANVTTSKFMPVADYVFAQDHYDQCDDLFTRRSLLIDALRVAGVYDKNNDGVKRLLGDSKMNELIGVDSWAMFAEKGGVKGAVDWLPIEQIANVLTVVDKELEMSINLSQQITGMSDILRGQSSQQTTATEQAIKARFASVRIQFLQDEFARFASDIQKLKAEIISKHFDPQTIIERSNIMRTPDAQLAQDAVQLIKSRFYEYRISVNPDSVSLTDFAALQKERFDFLQALTGFFQQSVPVVQMMGPDSVTTLLQIAQWTLAGLKGSNEIEGVFDQAVANLKQKQMQAAMNPPPPLPPDPKVVAAQVKGQAEQFKAKADIAKVGLDVQAAQQKHKLEMQKMAVEHVTTLQSEEAKQRTEALKAVTAATSNKDSQS